jgi:hypothetical protein
VADKKTRHISRGVSPAQGSMGVKSLTLRLPDDEYERLRSFAFQHRTTHQDVLARALRAYLDQRS